MKKLLIFFTVVMLSSGPVAAQMAPPPPMPRIIVVSGEATENVEPDQAALTVTLQSKDQDLNKAKAANDAMVEKIVHITREFEIPKEKVSTSNVYIAPQYSYPRPDNKPKFDYYMVNRTLRITIDKIEIHERLLSAVVDAKIDQVNGVEFLLKDREVRASSVRVKAFENAKAKALALAQAAGAKLGPVQSISTSGEAPIMPPRPMMMAKAMMSDSAEMSVAPSLPGTIALHESVSVSFSLE